MIPLHRNHLVTSTCDHSIINTSDHLPCISDICQSYFLVVFINPLLPIKRPTPSTFIPKSNFQSQSMHFLRYFSKSFGIFNHS